MNFICRILHKITETEWRYLLHHSKVRVVGRAEISKSAIIKDSLIWVGPDSFLKIGDDVVINGVSIYVYSGQLIIDECSYLEKDKNTITPEYILENNSYVHIMNHSRIRSQRLWSRFGSKLEIGCYTNINFGSEVRCDENIKIGSFCQISYNVRIWDTNTHSIYDKEKRREIARKYFPFLGKEIDKPKTREVVIGDDCWLGERASVLKGSCIGNNCIIGFNTTISGEKVQDDMCVVQNNGLHTFSKKQDNNTAINYGG